MVRFSGRKSVPVYVQQEFGFPETGTLRQRSAGLSSAISEPMESQRRKADRSQLACQSKLHRDQYDSFLEPAGSESFRVHSGRALHDQRPDIQSMFDDSQFAAAPVADIAEPDRWSVLQLDRYSRRWRDRKSTRLNSSHITISY